MKTCTKCGVPKEESNFQLRSDTGKLRGACHVCESARSNVAYHNNPGPRYASSRKWSLAHREQVRKTERDRKALDRPRHRAYARELSKTTQAIATRNNRKRKRYAEDPEFRVLLCLGNRLRDALRRTGVKKNAATLDLTGCPTIWLRIHLGSLFKPGMTWENYGSVWQIDHVLPCSSFDLARSELRRACFHWTNLQPLFATENLQKSDATPEQPTKEIGSRCCQASTRQQVL